MRQRAIAWAVRSGLGLAVLAPLLSLVPAALLDSGPDAPVRFSPFLLALATFDPLVWTCLWNGVALASAVSIGSVLIGVRLGRAMSLSGPWARPLWEFLAIAPAVIPPGFLALGLLGLFDPPGPAAWRRVVDGSNFWVGYPGQSWPWLIWGWSALAPGVGLVVLATTNALRGIDPRRGEAARLVGASSWQVWRTLTWPAVRPTVAESVGLVFVLNLADPAAPMVLGLRRTPGFQIASLAMGPGPFSRLAAIGLLVSLIAFCAGTLVRWWGGPAHGSLGPDRRSGFRAGSGRWIVRLAVIGALITWSALAWLPIVGLCRIGFARVPEADAGSGFATFLGRLASDSAWSSLSQSFLLGIGFVFAAVIVGPALVPASRGRWFLRVVEFVPPVVWGVALLALSRVLLLLGEVVRGEAGPPLISRIFEFASIMLDPLRLPGPALLAGVCLASLPRRAALGMVPRDDPRTIGCLVDQAVLAGTRPGPANRMARRSARTVATPRLMLWSTLAAISMGPAIVLAPTADVRPVGPGVVALSDGPGEARSQAAAIALASITAGLAALIGARISIGPYDPLAPGELA